MYKAGKKKWAQASVARMKEKGTEGSLTSAARSAGFNDTMEFAHHVMASSKATPKMKKKANWAININKK